MRHSVSASGGSYNPGKFQTAFSLKQGAVHMQIWPAVNTPYNSEDAQQKTEATQVSSDTALPPSREGWSRGQRWVPRPAAASCRMTPWRPCSDIKSDISQNQRMARAGTGLFSKVYKPETGTPTNTAHTQTKESKGSPPPHTLQMGKQGCLSTAGNLHKKKR